MGEDSLSMSKARLVQRSQRAGITPQAIPSSPRLHWPLNREGESCFLRALCWHLHHWRDKSGSKTASGSAKYHTSPLQTARVVLYKAHHKGAGKTSRGLAAVRQVKEGWGGLILYGGIGGAPGSKAEHCADWWNYDLLVDGTGLAPAVTRVLNGRRRGNNRMGIRICSNSLSRGQRLSATFAEPSGLTGKCKQRKAKRSDDLPRGRSGADLRWQRCL